MPANSVNENPDLRCRYCHDLVRAQAIFDHEIACFEYSHLQIPNRGDFEDTFLNKYGKTIFDAMVEAVQAAKKAERNEIADKVEKVLSKCDVEHKCSEPPGCDYCSLPDQIRENKYREPEFDYEPPFIPPVTVPVVALKKPAPKILQAFANDPLAVEVWPLMFENPDPDNIWQILYKQDVGITYRRVKETCEKLEPYVKIENDKR